jgi:alkylated DNA repair dioxygenase AlkB
MIDSPSEAWLMMTENHLGQKAGKNTPISTRLLNREGEIEYTQAFLEPAVADEGFLALREELDWQEEFIQIAGRRVQVPRRVAWHGEPGAIYRYSGVAHEPKAWTPALLELKAQVEVYCGQHFNSVLGNLYRDGNDAVGWHADNEPELGPAPFIASLSLGAERRFEIRHNKTREILRLPLAHGSLLTMGGCFQSRWKHRIPRQPGITQPRINLTFRHIEPSS